MADSTNTTPAKSGIKTIWQETKKVPGDLKKDWKESSTPVKVVKAATPIITFIGGTVLGKAIFGKKKAPKTPKASVSPKSQN